MDEKVIELIYRRTDFEEIYYRNGDDKILFNDRLKKERITFIIMCVFFLATLIYTLSIKNNYGFLIFIGILLSLAFFDWYKKALPSIKWTHEIRKYLDNLDKISHNKIILTDNAFTLVQDKKETIEKWTEFKRAEIEEHFVSLISNTTNYLFPKNSMTADEYQILRTMISNKIKNEL